MTAPSVPAVRVGSGKLRIAVGNLWLLYLYGSRLYGLLAQEERVAAEAAPQDLPELAARILCQEVQHRMERGLSQTYVEQHAVLTSVRDRIDHLHTARGNYLAQGKVTCSYTEMTVDTPRNRFVLAALDAGHRMLAPRTAAHAEAQMCRTTAAQLMRFGIQLTPLDRRDRTLEPVGRLDQADRRMLAAATMLLDMTSPSFAAGNRWVRQLDTLKDSRLRQIFEEAVRGYYRVNLPSDWEVGKRQLLWPNAPLGNASWPTMETDITITTSTGQRLVIDTKFTAALTEATPWRASTLKSAHLYQLHTYLASQEATGDPVDRTAAGLLLYPSTDQALDVTTRRQVGSHILAVQTIDLAAPSASIGESLRGIISELLPSQG